MEEPSEVLTEIENAIDDVNSENAVDNKQNILKRKHKNEEEINVKVLKKLDPENEDDENDDGACCTIVSITCFVSKKIYVKFSFAKPELKFITLIYFF